MSGHGGMADDASMRGHLATVRATNSSTSSDDGAAKSAFGGYWLSCKLQPRLGWSVVAAGRGAADRDPVGRPAAGLRAQVPLLRAAVRSRLPHAHPAGRDGGLGAAARLPMGVRRAAVRRGRARLLARRAWHVGAQGGGQARGQAHLCGAQQPLPRAHLPRDGGVRVRQGHPLEACDTTAGKLVCRTAPVYGGTGSPTEQGSRFDEAGYIAIPDCFWGGAEWGLEPPQRWTACRCTLSRRATPPSATTARWRAGAAVGV